MRRMRRVRVYEKMTSECDRLGAAPRIGARPASARPTNEGERETREAREDGRGVRHCGGEVTAAWSAGVWRLTCHWIEA